MTGVVISSYDASANRTLPQNTSFYYSSDISIRTLNTAYSPSQTLGLLYVPDVAGVCAQSLPANVTRFQHLPIDSPKIAIAPWISPSCTLSYLQAAPRVSAFIFYIPDQTNPPLASANSPTWSLGDGGHWKSVIDYPVYAIASQIGQQITLTMSKYSGNASDVLDNQQLLDNGITSDSQVRLMMQVATSNGGTNLPSIWIFLLIILAILIALIGTLSLTMHILQRKRRNDLRDRIARGEVNLEALGLDRMNTYTPSAITVLPEKGSSQAPPPLPLEQSTCAICLDDFAESQSQVRQLGCAHCFHSQCIDLFLLETSSLCPLCKQSVLPPGYVPGKITNAHVRRERYLRRNATRRARHAAGTQAPTASNLMLFGPRARASTNASGSPPVLGPPVEMTPLPAHMESTAATDQSTPTTAQGRREWARRRALAMSGLQESADDSEPQPRTSKARKLLRRVFPNL
ncbi:hypothetical protein E4T42_03506 [Aureobasidium subglaciale]|nr:hypothetical protein E4T42_03506 [Aureobasidium subglaciale]